MVMKQYAKTGLQLSNLLSNIQFKTNDNLNSTLEYNASTWILQGTVSNMLRKIESIKQDCGELCDTFRTGTPGHFFNQTTANFSCDSIFRNKFIDLKHQPEKCPHGIPTSVVNDFIMNGKMVLKKWYLCSKSKDTWDRFDLEWTKDGIDRQIKQAENGTLYGTYGHKVTNIVLDAMRSTENIHRGRVLVIGSVKPWIESCALSLQASETVTVDYGDIKSSHPRIRTMTPIEYRERFLNNTLGKFDAVISFSSLEHSGLGRYGDLLNPWADIIAVARAWCVTKPGGNLILGVPFGKDKLFFNAYREYGKYRYPFLTTNWRQKSMSFKSMQVSDPVFVFEK